MQIDFLFDVICPWCYIGKRRLEQMLAERGGTMPLINWQPFLLNPELPSGGIERNVYLAGKFGSESRVRRVYGAIADVGLSVEIGFNFDTIRHTPNSIDAHRLVRFAGLENKAETAVEALFKAYFVEGLNIGEPDVLTTIVNNIGLDADAFGVHLESDDGIADIYDANANAHRLGINGVPSYVFNKNMIISGAQDHNVLSRMLDAAMAADED
ncbi:MAG: DsbA family oxidoreductase [Rhodospirillaceae bacterium]|nr:DsbA family oxidoreductase [Rhodospirillaceae bacterium]MBL6941838.1 DsbA family oxidoreductase [Rhodospirillales bacterium]